MRMFISYSRVDRNYITQLVEVLRSVYDDVWYDMSLVGGQVWWDEILHQISRSDVFIFALSPESSDSAYCDAELKEAKRLQKVVLPIIVRKRTEIPRHLKHIHTLDLTELNLASVTELNTSLKEINKNIPTKQLAPLSDIPTPLPLQDQDEYKARIIQDLASANNKIALEAAKILKHENWHKDKSLDGAILASANLQGIVLDDSRMVGANLERSNLQGAKLSGSELREARFTSALLNRANLENCNLSNTEFADAQLDSANLKGANLSQANFVGTTLLGTDLSNADLKEAVFRRTDLSGADLSGADLRGTIFLGSILNNADFTDAKLHETLLIDLDLSHLRGIAKISHEGPSHISVDTILRSEKISDEFLESLGLPETFITCTKSLMKSGIDFYSCFISYSHTDREFARQLFDYLQEAGVRCWLDEKQIKPGDNIYEAIDQGIRYWDKVLLCCSEDSLNSWWIDAEIDAAFQKERDLIRDRSINITALIPLDLDGYLFSDLYTSGKVRQLQSRLAANFQGWEHDNSVFVQGVEGILKALRTDGGKEAPPESKL